MEFEWDANKNKYNIEKHGISFYDAIQIFKGKCISYPSPRNDENRVVIIGIVQDRAIAVIYTVREGKIRIISARAARRQERALYDQKKQQYYGKDS